jgi:hypothetical protein
MPVILTGDEAVCEEKSPPLVYLADIYSKVFFIYAF